ncbi:hypothetical protein PFISCL1PPCAC_14646, partial [Pristionchus fissidentatus]
NYSAIISSFLLAGGVVMILISQQGDEFNDVSTGMSSTSASVVLGIGITLAVIGTLGFVFTVLQVIRRADKRMTAREMSKLQVEVQRKMDIRSRKHTVMSQVPSIMVTTASN